MAKLPKVSFTLPLAYPLFNTNYHGPFGGWEVRVSLIARELARRGNFQASILVGDYGQPHISQIDGVELISWQGKKLWGVPAKTWNPFPLGSTLAILYEKFERRVLDTIPQYLPGQTITIIGSYPILRKNIAIYEEIDADVYIVPGNTPFSAEAAFYCGQKGKKFVFMAGSDMDYYPQYKTNQNKFDIYGTPYALKNYSIQKADAHIVQNETQQKLLHEGYNRNSILVKNPIDIQPKFAREPEKGLVLWVGKSDERVKRPSIVLELAQKIRTLRFVLIMNRAQENVHQEIIRKASNMSNVEIIESVPFSKIESFFARAEIHLNTSTFEGFPNTYLQAAKYGVPTVSMRIDPGGMLSKYGCGLVSGDSLEELENSIRRLVGDHALYDATEKEALTYIRQHHDKESIAKEFENALHSIITA